MTAEAWRNKEILEEVVERMIISVNKSYDDSNIFLADTRFFLFILKPYFHRYYDEASSEARLRQSTKFPDFVVHDVSDVIN